MPLAAGPDEISALVIEAIDKQKPGANGFHTGASLTLFTGFHTEAEIGPIILQWANGEYFGKKLRVTELFLPKKQVHMGLGLDVGWSCRGCQKFKWNMKQCAKCLVTHYCSTECQSKHWHEHKPICKAIKGQYAATREFYPRPHQIKFSVISSYTACMIEHLAKTQQYEKFAGVIGLESTHHIRLSDHERSFERSL